MTREKRRYWERRLSELLLPLDFVDLVRLSWILEAVRSGRIEPRSKFSEFPGCTKDHQIGGAAFVPPWGIDSILNEWLRLAGTSTRTGKVLDLRNWKAIAKLVDVYGGLANVESAMNYGEDGVLAALPRLFWPQHNWQLGFTNKARIGRAWRVYASEGGKTAFQEKFDFPLERFLKVAFELFALTEDFPAARLSAICQNGSSRSDILKTVSLIGGEIPTHIQLAKDFWNADLPREFQRSSLKERPIVTIKNEQDLLFFVPSRDLLLQRVTDGLFYDLVSSEVAKQSYAKAFEELCFDLIYSFHHDGCVLSPERDTSYGKSADIIQIHEGSKEAIVYECKSRRLPLRVLSSANPWEDHKQAFDDVVKGIVQIWRTASEILVPIEIKSTGLVVLYDPWTLMANTYLQELFERAHSLADGLELTVDCRVPVGICGFFDLERSLRRYDFHELGSAIRLSDNYLGYELIGICEEVHGIRKPKKSFDFSDAIRDAVSWWPI